MRRRIVPFLLAVAASLAPAPASANYQNFESSHVHPIDLTPSGGRLLAVNTPDARLEVFTVAVDGRLAREASIPVGLEPVTVVARTDSEAWVVNMLSDSVSIVDLDQRVVTRTIVVGDEPTDVVFANGPGGPYSRAFVAVSEEDAVKVYEIGNLSAPPLTVALFSRDIRALAVSGNGSKVYAVALKSGNETTVMNANVAFNGTLGFNQQRLADLGLNGIQCSGPHPPYPPLPPGILRNPALVDPPNGGTANCGGDRCPPVGLIVKWDRASGQWRDDAGQNWNACLPVRLPDHDLFIIDAVDPIGVAQVQVDHLGTSLFEISVRPGPPPAGGRIYIPNTEAGNLTRFEHPLGVQGRMVENRIAVVDPNAANQVTIINLNTHIDPASDPATNLAERRASISQPGMMVWRSDGSAAYLTAIGSRKVFRVDGACLAGGCIFGSNRSAPAAVEVGEGPTGAALHEGSNRLYVLSRFSNSISVVDPAGSMSRIGDVPLHDPSSATIRLGRRFLYDGIDSSRHGDAACSSCHLSGDNDGLAWDLGDPTGTMAPYNTEFDNVRFFPFDGSAAHQGFDPQKGPMATQTLRAMLEPLHWRGDRPTMRDFNKAFVGLMGKEDIDPSPTGAAGLTAADMDLFRSFALGIRMPPNPFRKVDDTLPNALVQPRGSPFAGNPAVGEARFNGAPPFSTSPTDGGTFCVTCHQNPFGSAGGKLDGVEPIQTSASADATALFNGNADGSPHSDLEVPHLRNMHEKFGPTFGPPGGPYPDSKTGFGFIHDGSIPDLGTFLSADVFNLTAAAVRDIAVFMFHFPTGTKPAVGRQVTVPAGTPPTGTPQDEALLGSLITLGNLANAGRHCELVASARSGGRPRTWYLDGGAGTGGLWTTDVAGELQVSTATLRQGAASPVTFTCGTLGSGARLGSDRDLDGHLNGDDCADGDATTFAPTIEVTNLTVAGTGPTTIAWDDQGSLTGVGTVLYEVASGNLSELRASGLAAATSCLAGGLPAPSYDDTRPDPPIGEGAFYLARATNACGPGGFGPGLEAIDAITCP